jgi:hypothetical protein
MLKGIGAAIGAERCTAASRAPERVKLTVSAETAMSTSVLTTSGTAITVTAATGGTTVRTRAAINARTKMVRTACLHGLACLMLLLLPDARARRNVAPSALPHEPRQVRGQTVHLDTYLTTPRASCAIAPRATGATTATGSDAYSPRGFSEEIRLYAPVGPACHGSDPARSNPCRSGERRTSWSLARPSRPDRSIRGTFRLRAPYEPDDRLGGRTSPQPRERRWVTASSQATVDGVPLGAGREIPDCSAGRVRSALPPLPVTNGSPISDIT